MAKHEDVIALRFGEMQLNNGRWSEEEKERLTSMYYDGVEFSEMALMLHRNERAVSAMIDKLGLRKRSRASWSRKGCCLCGQCDCREICTKKDPCK